jgi:hypothetical protein
VPICQTGWFGLYGSEWLHYLPVVGQIRDH